MSSIASAPGGDQWGAAVAAEVKVVIALVPSGSVFVARDRELAVVADALTAGPALIVIEGEAGVGKSRLLAEVAGSHRMLVGSAPPYSHPHTLAPLIDALRSSGGPGGLGLSPLGGALRPLFPEWTADLPGALPPAEDVAASRHRVFRALLEILDAVEGTVLALEDVHWADDTTLEFLLYLVAQRPLPINLLLTMRPSSQRSDSLLTKLTSRPPAGGVLVQLQLEPLKADGTRRLISALLDDQAVSDEFAGFIFERTDGVPLAVEESVRLMRDRADIIQRGGEWKRHNLRGIHVPAAVREAVLERVSRLEPDTQLVLRAASVVSDPVDAATLLAIAELSPTTTAHLAAADSGLLSEQLAGRYAFAHALSAQAVYEAIAGDERRAMHARVADHLTVLGSASPAVLARHFREAGEIEHWAACTQQAVSAALELGDEATAATMLHDLLAHANLLPTTVVDLARRLPRSALTIEQIADLVHVLRNTLDASELSSGERSLLCLYLAELLATGEQAGSMCHELEAALQDLDPGSPEAVRAMLVLGWIDETDRPRAVRLGWLRRAEAAIPGLPPADRRKAWRVLAGGLLNLGDDAGWQAGAKVTADTTAPPGVRAMLELNLGEAAMAWGRYDEARRHLLSALQTASSIGYQQIAANAQAEIVTLDWLQGLWAGLMERAEVAAADDGVRPSQRLSCRLVMALLHGLTGQLDVAVAGGQQVLADAIRYGWQLDFEPEAALAGWYTALGRSGDAVLVTDDPLEVVRCRDMWHWGSELFPARVAALKAVGRSAEATALVGDYAAAATSLGAPSVQASVRICRALASTDDSHAAELFGEASEIYEAMPRPYAALLARARGAERWLGTQSDRPEVVAILHEVAQGLSDLGAKADEERVRSILHAAEGEVSGGRKAGRPGYGDRLSPRELEVVRLVIAGHTNRGIAESLHRSPNTVSSQLNAAMRKLRVTSRTALAVAALELGVEAR